MNTRKTLYSNALNALMLETKEYLNKKLYNNTNAKKTQKLGFKTYPISGNELKQYVTKVFTPEFFYQIPFPNFEAFKKTETYVDPENYLHSVDMQSAEDDYRIDCETYNLPVILEDIAQAAGYKDFESFNNAVMKVYGVNNNNVKEAADFYDDTYLVPWETNIHITLFEFL